MVAIQKRAKRHLLIGFGCSLLILISSSVLSYLSIMELLDSQRWVEHTTNVETGLNDIISRMKDAETGQRGFLLTGDETFLEPFADAEQEVINISNEVQLLTRDNLSQQKDFPVLEQLVKNKFKFINKTINDKKKGIPPTVNGLLSGKSIMDSIRTVIHTMVNRETKLMAIRSAKMNKYVMFAPIAIAVAALLAMAITLIFYFKVNKDAGASIELQNELLEKEKRIQKQIEIIGNVAKKVADGDYSTRIDKVDLE